MKFAFTLAEVLITLGIIGVVSSMTLPAVVQKEQEKVTVARVKKAYSILSQAYLMTSQKYGTPDEWGATTMNEASSHIFVANKFIPFMKVTKNCIGMSSVETQKYCTKTMYDINSYASVKIADGITIIFRTWNGNCSTNHSDSNKYLQNVCGWIAVDTNATGKPDIWGRDIFSFYLTKYGIYPQGTEHDSLSMQKYCTSSRVFSQFYGDFANGQACSAWVLHNENMDYLHCSDISWQGKKYCKK